ncbi:glycosyltransferase [Enterococcus faecium]|uniref:glycosyltransferase n=1 Tax=Enterococcus faecium TaxID=1352 RepID=UPI0010C087F4|nr:glycosyltransferase [Enterococcus faecium]TKO53063.1 glycosyltransferase [Enterococcus faecium]
MHTVTILMSTYNGEKYLKDQLNSLINQIGVNISVLVRDDGSTDSTCEILEEYRNRMVLTWYSGENIGSARSFLHLISKAPKTEYYAFCDQDDIWNDDKLYRAISMLKSIENKNLPQLYCSNYQLVDANLNNLPDNGHVSTVTFPASLVSSCCTGCTVVFNYNLLLKLRVGEPSTIVMHDDWAHKVCLAVGGKVIYDSYKSLKYRQHDKNVDGGVHKISKRITELSKRFFHKECSRSNQLKELIRIYCGELTEDNLKLLKKVAYYREKGIIFRIKLVNSSKIVTPYKKLNVGFKIGVLGKYF